jgi:hypothetical protein
MARFFPPLVSAGAMVVGHIVIGGNGPSASGAQPMERVNAEADAGKVGGAGAMYQLDLNLELYCAAPDEVSDNPLDRTSRYVVLYRSLDLTFPPSTGVELQFTRVPPSERLMSYDQGHNIRTGVPTIFRLESVVYVVKHRELKATLRLSCDSPAELRRMADEYVRAYGFSMWYRSHLSQGLYSAIKADDMPLFEALLQQAEGQETHDQKGLLSTLHHAAGKGSIRAVQLLLDAGVDADSADEFGRTALMEAASAGETAMGNLLLSAGAHVNRSTNSGVTALLCASLRGHHDTVKMLHAAGADLEIAGPRGETALMRAAQVGDVETVRLLLTLGANPNSQGEIGKTAAELMAEHDRYVIMELLRGAG